MLRAHAATAPAAARTDPAAAPVIGRLTPEFREQPGPRTVERIVLQAHHDLDDMHPPALPELWERLARQRLLESAGR